jgi:Pretoxin HINT domain
MHGHKNYFANCTEYTEYADGNVSINNVVFHREDLGGIDPRDVAQAIDDFAGHSVGGIYWEDPTGFTLAVLGDAVNAAANHEAELAAKQKALECQASFWCRNAGIIGAVAGIIAGVGCGLLIGWTGVGAVACGFVGGFVASLTTGLLEGQSLSDPSLWINAGIGGVIGAVSGGVGFGIGGVVARGIAAQAGAGIVERIAAGAFTGAIAGGVAGAAGGGLSYGAGCLLGAKCTASGFADAVEHGFVTGAVAGGIAGGISGARASSCHSFDPDTKVLMAAGTARAIKDIEVGDEVAATDPATGQTTAQPVTTLHLNNDTDLTDLTITVAASGAVVQSARNAANESDGTIRGPTTSVLHTTAHHPFWDATAHTWVGAGALIVGHGLRTVDGRAVKVTAARSFASQKIMRDLTVAHVHSYYVIAGTVPVLVHNCGGARFVVDSDGVATDIQPGGRLPDEIISTFMGGRYTSRVLENDTVFYRAGVEGSPLGQFFDNMPPLGVIQTRIDNAIPLKWPTGQPAPLDTGFAISIPRGTIIYEGLVAPQGGIFLGGTYQAFIPKPWNVPGVRRILDWPLG